MDCAMYVRLRLSLPRATEEVFQILEDNQVTLSTMKASRYVRAFDKEVDKWERTLSHILEVIEMILQVQKQWMYLEVGGVGGGRGRTPLSEVADLLMGGPTKEHFHKPKW